MTTPPFIETETLEHPFAVARGAGCEGLLTTHRQAAASPVCDSGQLCCLVQIYPIDVVHGMFPMTGEEILVGRDASSHLVLADASVSRRHVGFKREGSEYRLLDLGSTNGTHVNGKPVTEVVLRSGDTIQIGSFLFKFLSAGSVESQYHETVYAALIRDALTGAMNKRYLLDFLEREVARSIRHRLPLSVAMIDIDRFKSINDSYGHLVGDQILKEFGGRLLAACRRDDQLARYGGEEFCLVLPSTGISEAFEIAERCRRVILDPPFETSMGPLPVTASFGIAELDFSTSTTAVELIRIADERLYRAKQSGRNRVEA